MTIDMEYTVETEPKRVTCAECRWWEEYFDGTGFCRAHPPRKEEDGEGYWLKTDKDDWCGEAVRR